MKKITFLILTTFSSVFSFGQNVPKTLLWEVSKPGISHKSYMFATFHEVNPAFFLSLTNTVEKLNAAKVVYLEQLFNGKSDTTGTGRITTWNTQKWHKAMTPEQGNIFKDFVGKAEDTSYYQLPPLPLFLTIFRIYGQNFCDTSYNSTSGEIMDSYIEKLALKNKQTVLPLDGNQLNIIEESSRNMHQSKDSLLTASSVDLMKKMLANDDSECNFINDYKQFNLDYQFDTEISKMGFPPQFVLDRNNKWVTILDKSFKASPCFVAVGLRHFFYKEGLVQQLIRLGYEVKPVPAR
jgi:uncharacterized protein YbaP (TraB family)